jgi:ABC-2 type transport system ATP-binding protein
MFSDFSLHIAPGRIYGLLGKNGTGKSTLLYLISGLLRPHAGTVTVEGQESRLRKPELLQEMFFVPEEYAMPNMSFDAFTNMMRAFYPHFSDELLRQCLADFEMPTRPNLKELSMGQKKKVYMSFAIATNTRLLMMDEPTNGLDIPSKTLFRKVIANYMTDDRTLIISTHQVHDIESLLDHVIIINNSSVLLDSSIADISRHYAFRYLTPQEMDDTVIYAEPSLQGNAVIMPRGEGEETQVDLELLFNATISGKMDNKK